MIITASKKMDLLAFDFGKIVIHCRSTPARSLDFAIKRPIKLPTFKSQVSLDRDSNTKVLYSMLLL